MLCQILSSMKSIFAGILIFITLGWQAVKQYSRSIPFQIGKSGFNLEPGIQTVVSNSANGNSRHTAGFNKRQVKM